MTKSSCAPTPSNLPESVIENMDSSSMRRFVICLLLLSPYGNLILPFSIFICRFKIISCFFLRVVSKSFTFKSDMFLNSCVNALAKVFVSYRICSGSNIFPTILSLFRFSLNSTFLARSTCTTVLFFSSSTSRTTMTL